MYTFNKLTLNLVKISLRLASSWIIVNIYKFLANLFNNLMSKIKKYRSIKSLAARYQFLVIDIWGVLHDGGTTAFPEAIELLKWLSGHESIITILMSNSPRTKDEVERSLQAVGIKREYYNHLHTSGQEVLNQLKERRHPFLKNLGKRGYVIGKSNIHTQAGDEDVVDFLTADYLLATRVPNDDLSSAIPMLNKALSAKIPMICANPDEHVPTTFGVKQCPGVMYKYYKEKKGAAIAFGKPFPDIYKRIFFTLRNKYSNFNSERTLVIGDGLFTDILGANEHDVDSVLITDGIHKDKFEDISKMPAEMNKSQFHVLSGQAKAAPNFICERFE